MTRTATWAARMTAAGVAAVLMAAAGPTRGQEEKAYDLRGPAPKKGEVLTTTSTFKIDDAAVKLKVMGMVVEARQTLTADEVEEVKVVAVEGRQATKVQTKVVKEKVETKTSIGGADMDDTKDGDLDGEVIVSERTGPGKWKHSLVDTKPSDKQRKELDRRVGPENQDDLYPAGKVAVGHKWEVDAAALQRVFGGSITDLKGKLKMSFVKVEEVDGQECAVIQAEGTIKGIAKADEGDLNVEMDLKGTTWRAVKTGVDVKDKAKGTLKMSGKVDMDGAKIDLELDGPFTIDSTAKLKPAKGD